MGTNVESHVPCFPDFITAFLMPFPSELFAKFDAPDDRCLKPFLAIGNRNLPIVLRILPNPVRII